MTIGRPATAEAVKLLHLGIRALTRMSANGFPVDEEEVKKSIASCEEEMKKIEGEAWAMPGGREWKNIYGTAATLSNSRQGAKIFYDVLGFDRIQDEDVGEDSLDKDALADIDHPLADCVTRYRKLERCMNTNLTSFLAEAVDGKIHPFFSLSTAISYRSSSTNPNGQNMPVRDPEVAGYVRQCVRAPKNWRIVESDYSGIEVLVAACYHKDPTMLHYLRTGHDMHRDVSKEIYMLQGDDEYWKGEGKKCRYSAKNGFVFPEFYGSFWSRVALALWKNISRLQLEAPGSVPLQQHLLKKGIKGLGEMEKDERGNPVRGSRGSFYEHVRQVEKAFWEDRFAVYDKWKKDWHAAYRQCGHFQSLTGFNYAGIFRRNQVINLPVQGSASHVKLQALINIDKTIRRHKMRVVPILEIHDSIISLVHQDEFDDYVELIQREMVDKINRKFKWLLIPVSVEIEASPPGGTWHEKKLVQ